MKIINLYGGPGSGKSTTAAGLFFLMKTKGYKVELINEYAKEMVYEGRDNILGDQLYIFAKQRRKLERLKNEVDYVISDSPIILSLVYDNGYYQNFAPLVKEIFDTYDNINFYINRSKEYQKFGRYQTKDEAIKKDWEIRKMLDDEKYEYLLIDGDKEAPNHILNIIENVKK